MRGGCISTYGPPERVRLAMALVVWYRTPCAAFTQPFCYGGLETIGSAQQKHAVVLEAMTCPRIAAVAA